MHVFCRACNAHSVTGRTRQLVLHLSVRLRLLDHLDDVGRVVQDVFFRLFAGKSEGELPNQDGSDLTYSNRADHSEALLPHD